MKIKPLVAALLFLGFALGFILKYGSPSNKLPVIIGLFIISFIIAAIWFWRHRT